LLESAPQRFLDVSHSTPCGSLSLGECSCLLIADCGWFWVSFLDVVTGAEYRACRFNTSRIEPTARLARISSAKSVSASTIGAENPG
jgi:hypothetical protein